MYLATLILILCLSLDLKEVRPWLQIIRPEAALDDFVLEFAETGEDMAKNSRQKYLDKWTLWAKSTAKTWLLWAPLEVNRPDWDFKSPFAKC